MTARIGKKELDNIWQATRSIKNLEESLIGENNPADVREFFRNARLGRSQSRQLDEIENLCPDWINKTVAFYLSDYHPPSDETARVLSVGCGYFGFEEYCAFRNFLTGIGKAQEYTGVDISEQNLKRTKQLLSQFSNAKVVLGDARMLTEIVSGKYDIVISRHPECEKPANNSIWAEIFSQVREVMKDDSMLMVTGLSEPNHYLATKTVYDCGFGLHYHGPNKFPGPKSGECCGRYDKYVTLATKNI